MVGKEVNERDVGKLIIIDMLYAVYFDIYVDIQAHWGRFDCEEKQQKRAKEKVALEQKKLDIDMLEAKRQQRKLNFLLTNRTICPFHGQEDGTPFGGKLTIKLKLNLANIIICCQETEESHDRAVVGEKFGLSMSEATGDCFGC